MEPIEYVIKYIQNTNKISLINQSAYAQDSIAPSPVARVARMASSKLEVNSREISTQVHTSYLQNSSQSRRVGAGRPAGVRCEQRRWGGGAGRSATWIAAQGPGRRPPGVRPRCGAPSGAPCNSQRRLAGGHQGRLQSAETDRAHRSAQGEKPSALGNLNLGKGG